MGQMGVHGSTAHNQAQRLLDLHFVHCQPSARHLNGTSFGQRPLRYNDNALLQLETLAYIFNIKCI